MKPVLSHAVSVFLAFSLLFSCCACSKKADPDKQKEESDSIVSSPAYWVPFFCENYDEKGNLERRAEFTFEENGLLSEQRWHFADQKDDRVYKIDYSYDAEKRLLTGDWKSIDWQTQHEFDKNGWLISLARKTSEKTEWEKTSVFLQPFYIGMITDDDVAAYTWRPYHTDKGYAVVPIFTLLPGKTKEDAPYLTSDYLQASEGTFYWEDAAYRCFQASDGTILYDLGQTRDNLREEDILNQYLVNGEVKYSKTRITCRISEEDPLTEVLDPDQLLMTDGTRYTDLRLIHDGDTSFRYFLNAWKTAEENEDGIVTTTTYFLNGSVAEIVKWKKMDSFVSLISLLSFSDSLNEITTGNAYLLRQLWKLVAASSIKGFISSEGEYEKIEKLIPEDAFETEEEAWEWIRNLEK